MFFSRPDVRRVTLLASALVAAAVFAACPHGSSGWTPTETVSYGLDPAQTADVYRAAQPNSPVVIALHAGGWSSGSKSEMGRTCTTLVVSGFACIAVEYRMVPQSVWPAQMDDLRAALAWEQSHLTDLNGSNWLGWWGTSAGGQLALMGAYTLGGNAVVAWSAPTNLTTMTTLTDTVAAFLGCYPASCPQQAASASPALQVTNVPTFLVQAQNDAVVEYSQATELATKMNGELLIVPSSAHAGALWDDAWTQSEQWLQATEQAQLQQAQQKTVRSELFLLLSYAIWAWDNLKTVWELLA